MKKLFASLALLSLVAAPSLSRASSPEKSFNFGIGSVADKFHFGAGFKLQWPTELENQNLKFGGRTGFFFGPGSPTSFVIPILATGEYEFRTSMKDLKPYAGLEMGASIAHAASHTNTDFAILFVPGVNISGDRKVYFEIPFGSMGGDFSIIPTAGIRF